ncbi:Toxin A [Tyzzerella nexilis]|uniref:Toxin A n=1 Tax=[Clostridium] nexile TaxID=29361 RepID=A0A6N2UUL6_9FIRM
MKSIRKRFVAIILLAVMVFSDFQMSTSLAMDNSSAVEETEVAETDVANIVKAENRLNYILVESPYLESPNTQNIVVSWGDGTEQISNMRITVQKEDGSTEEWTCSNQSGYLYVFSKEYVDESEQSTYKVTDIRFEENQQEQCFLLTDLDVEAEFGVNKAYDGIEELQPLDPEDAVETSIVTIDENGETEAQDNIASALTAVSEEMGAVAGIRSAEKAGEIVVALDPGHDNRHGGTSGSGLTEQELTLKIAKYAKAELETYNGVKVYMTRTTAACPYPETGTSGACIEKRVQAAAKAGAKIYVSLHLNSGPASANGAEIIIPNSSWKPQLSTQGKELAEKILNELAAVGLNKRPTPIYSKDTTVNEKYPDGSISDYYSVQICAKEAGIPGIIVEHAFLSNSNDVNKFLKTEAGLKKLGVADATGIAKYLGLSKGQWVQVGDKWKYLTNGKYVVNQWMNISGETYYFDGNGYRVTGWQTIAGKKYYFMSDGHMHTGWLSFGSRYYYMMPDGHMHTGWLSFGSTYYYLNSEGIRVTGWQTIDGQRYYFMPDGTRHSNGWLSFGSTYYYMMADGHMHTGWLSFGSTYYYLNSNGVRVTGWQTIEGKEYYFDQNGVRKDNIKRSGWQTINGKKYYFDKNGEYVTGWQTIAGKKYYFMSDGHMHTGWLSFGSRYYYMMPDGYMHTGWLSFGSTYYYMNDEGLRVTGWQTVAGKKYYFMPDGTRYSNGWLSFGSTYYYMMPDGHMHTGWLSFGSTYYYLNSEGIRVTGWQTIAGKEYYFDQNGVRKDNIKRSGWQTINGKKYYFDKNGEYVTGWQTIAGKKYYFMSDGHMHTGWLSFGSRYYYMMPDGYMHTGWLSFGSTYYYMNDEGLRVTGWQTIAGKKYYFMPDGTRYSNGWLSFGSTYYYMMPDGHMHTGWLSFGSTYYYLNSNGVRVTGWQTIDGEEYYFDKNGVRQEGYLIEGTSAVTANNLAMYFKRKNGVYPTFYKNSDAPTIEKFCQIYVEEAKAEGIKVEVAFMQAMVETGWLKFGGSVQISQYNFAGIGALDGGVQGATFKTVREGVRAQIQHLKAYANEKSLNNTQVDPRFHLVKRGSAKYVEWLGQKENPNGYGWATAEEYGYKILRLIKEL